MENLTKLISEFGNPDDSDIQILSHNRMSSF